MLATQEQRYARSVQVKKVDLNKCKTWGYQPKSGSTLEFMQQENVRLALLSAEKLERTTLCNKVLTSCLAEKAEKTYE